MLQRGMSSDRTCLLLDLVCLLLCMRPFLTVDTLKMLHLPPAGHWGQDKFTLRKHTHTFFLKTLKDLSLLFFFFLIKLDAHAH